MNVKLIGEHKKDSRACRDGLALGGHIDEDDVAQLALREVGNADNGRVALDTAPLIRRFHRRRAGKRR